MAMVMHSWDIEKFRANLEYRIDALREESGMKRFSFPIGLFFVIDEANGGDATAVELERRFHLLDIESKNFIDFHYLGWNDLMEFELSAFEDFRNFLRKNGLTEFGGNADLILIDLEVDNDQASLRFDRAIRVDLSERAVREGQSLGRFLQNIVSAAERLYPDYLKQTGSSAVYEISDSLGIAYAQKSFLQWVLKKWGGIVGATGLKDLALQRLGPSIFLEDLR